MNYFAHGRRFTHEPYFLAGTATPDWLSVIDRKMRARAKRAALFIDDADPRMAQLARGIVQHHTDDDWFHQTPAFTELSLQFTVAIRDLLSPDDGFRPSFLGHILVELLLDAALFEDDLPQLDAYYAALAELDPEVVQQGINAIATKQTDRITALLPRFLADRFLYDYLEDAKLLTRLGHIMRRVGLPGLPAELAALFPSLRASVRQRQAALLGG
jgi:hypothetical protein